MSDHDFEKQVHQKLEELKLRPSDAVWMGVEKNIRLDNRRRRFIWLWLPMLFICLTTSAYVLYRYTQNTENISIAQAVPASSSSNATTVEIENTTKQTTNITPESVNKQTGKNTSVHSLQPTGSKQPDVSTPAATHETAPVATLSNERQPEKFVIEKNKNSKETIGNNNKRPVQKTLAYYANDNMPVTGSNNNNLFNREKSRYIKKRSAQTAIVIKENPVKLKPVLLSEEVQPEPAVLNVAMPAMVNNIDSNIATNKAVPSPFNSKSMHIMIPDSLSNMAAEAMPIQRKRSALWHWGIVADAGLSRIAESKLLQLKGLLGQEKYYDAFASPGGSTGSNSFLNVSATTATKKASPIQPDVSFSAGVFVQRAISRRFKLSLGLEYSYMSVNTQVGYKINAPIVINTGTSSAKIVSEYYKGPGFSSASADATLQNGAAASQGTYYSQKYRYRFQFIEMPLMVNWQINKGRKLPPVVFEGGVSISRLLSVDALHFEGIKGVYYKDNDLFNKTQFNFVTGLSIGILQKSKHPIWIGPNIRYAFSGLIKKDVSSGQYLWSTGISVKMQLGRL